jgi:alanine racemase
VSGGDGFTPYQEKSRGASGLVFAALGNFSAVFGAELQRGLENFQEIVEALSVMLPPSIRRSWAEIDVSAFHHNLRAIRGQLAPEVQVMGVIKANAYGHGLPLVAEALADSVEILGVANVAEAREVRQRAPKTPIFILGPALPDERPEIVDAGFVPSISNLAEARAFGLLAESFGKIVDAHLILDTGMGRIGLWEDDAERTAREIAVVRNLAITGIGSHLPVADEDAEFTDAQLDRFTALAQRLRDLVFPGAALHIENSAGVIAFGPKAGDLVRAGLMLYGSSPLPEFQSRLRAVMTWKARITLIREVPAGRGVSYGRTFITPHLMRIATIGAGYADGFRRHLSNRGASVLVGGRRCAVLGRVTMDQILVDITAVPEAVEGDEAVLLGRQGAEEIYAADVAQMAGTIPWDVFTGIGQRVDRVAINAL